MIFSIIYFKCSYKSSCKTIVLMEAPQFIFELFEKELRAIQIKLLGKVATAKGLDPEDLVEEFLPERGLRLVPNTKTIIQVKKKNAPPAPPSAESRCMARVWNRGKGGQCVRPRSSASKGENVIKCDYCSQHTKNRKHGRIDESPGKDIFPKEAKSVYK
jgi:hypothetical protein